MAPGPDGSVRGPEGPKAPVERASGRPLFRAARSLDTSAHGPLSTVSRGEGSSGRCTGPGAGVAEAFGTGPREARRLEGSEEGTGEREGRAGHAGPCNAGEQLAARN